MAEYNSKAKALSMELLREIDSGKISISEGAKRANEMRNVLMDALRGRTSEIAQAYAFNRKKYGKALPELEEKYAKQLFNRSFEKLPESKQNIVWKEIVFSAGRPQTKATRLAKILGLAGRAFIALTITVSVYNVVTSDDVLMATAKESAIIGSGLMGSLAGGAVAGLACGPGAPVCSAIGIFVGGVMFAIGTEVAFDVFWSKP
jgi:hypothetical protein